MKAYTGTVGQVVITSGRELPRAPVPGQLFQLDVDMQPVDPLLPWYHKGTYVYNGLNWMLLNGMNKQRVPAVIGAQAIEVEVPNSFEQQPTRNTGFGLCSALISPTNRTGKFSGSGSVWVDASADGYVWIAAFRKDRICGLALAHVTSGNPASLSISFLDLPASFESQTYELRLFTDVVGTVYVNQGMKMSFEGVSESVFIVEEV